jgi:hypothetical protein
MGKWRIYSGVKSIKVCYLYMYGDSIKKPTKYCFLKGGRNGEWLKGI